MAENIAQWLDGLGLGQYAQAFTENHIDFNNLQSLTEDDFKELGLSIGHRRNLQAAIRALSVEGSDEPLTSPPNQAIETPTAEAERRQVTVMFCDLVGSTALSSKLDPEDMRTVIRSYQDSCAGVVAHYEGFVAKYLGDGALAYFGYPKAFENDAERAIRAGLEVVTAVGGLQALDGEPLAARVGIATGTVVVGDILGERVAQEVAITGDTPNLAARLQDLAEPGSVVIGSATRALAGALFETADLGAHKLKGFAEPVPAWAVLRPRRTETRFEALSLGRLQRLVGRDEELEILHRRWDRAKAGDGQVVLISGEPGIGKSRLVHALEEAIAGEDYRAIRVQCSPYHINSALHPIAGHVERVALIEPEDDIEAKLEKLEAWVAQSSPTPMETTALLAPYLGIEPGDRYSVSSLPPQVRKQRMIEFFVDRQLNLEVDTPTLYVVEDAHWIDPTSKELLDQYVANIISARVLILMTFRPEFQPPWLGQPHISLMVLRRLSRTDSIALAGAIAEENAASSELLESIAERTDGIPLFIEELTKSVSEWGERDGIPGTLQDTLEARLDRLGEAREIAQIGAVIGRSFGFGLLSKVCNKTEMQLATLLDELERFELISRRGTPPEAIYSFKHTMIQDVAYANLLRSRRHELHATIAQTLETDYPKIAEAEPEIVAHHFALADDPDRSSAYWLKAGERANEGSASHEARAHLTMALEQIALLPESLERDRRELEIQVALGAAWLATKGFAASEVGETYARARELATNVGASEQMFPILFNLWINTHQRGMVGRGSAIAQAALDAARSDGSTDYLLEGHHANWTAHYGLCDLKACRMHAAEGTALYDFDQHRDHAFTYGGHDPGVCGHTHIALTNWLLGLPDTAARHAENAVALNDRLDHPFTTAVAMTFVGSVYHFRREPERVLALAERAIKVCAETGIAPNYGNYAAVLHGWAVCNVTGSDRGVDEILAGIAGWRETGASLRVSYYLAILAEAYAACGRTELAMDAAAEAHDLVEESGERKWEPEILRLRGELNSAISPHDADVSEKMFSQSRALAREIGARSLELRTAISLARLWHSQNKIKDAHDLLFPVYSGFSEGFDTADLKEAKALLNRLS